MSIKTLLVGKIDIYPDADSYVDSVNPDTNYGGLNTMYIRRSTGVETRRAYLKFSLASIPPGVQIVQAMLYVYTYDGLSVGPQWRCYSVADDTWTELGITWNNKPDLGPEAEDDLFPIYNKWGIWHRFLCTKFIKGEFEGDKVASLALQAVADLLAYIYTKEFDGYDPYLRVTYVRT